MKLTHNGHTQDSRTRSTVDFYDDLAPDYDDLRFGSFKNRVGQLLEERVLDAILSRLPGTDVLDVGSGTGRIARMMVRRYPNVDLVEPARGMIDVLKSSRNLAVCRIVRAGLQNLPFRDSTFDVITCIRVVWHLARPESGLVELARVLKPGGHLLFDIANPMSLTHVVERIRGSSVEMVFTSQKDVANYLEGVEMDLVERVPHRSPFLQVLPRRLEPPHRWTDRFLRVETLFRNVRVPRNTLCLIDAKKRPAV